MLNRQQLDGNRIRFEDFALSSSAPFMGQQYELPMNAFGSSVTRFQVVKVHAEGAMLIAEAELVTQ